MAIAALTKNRVATKSDTSCDFLFLRFIGVPPGGQSYRWKEKLNARIAECARELEVFRCAA
jgi:hypothetical protein